MIFASHNYQNFNNSNKQLWPLQPPTQENWNKMVNSEMYFCKNRIFNIFIWKHYTKEYPESFHPYWQFQVLKSDLKYTKRFNKNKKIKYNFIKYHFYLILEKLYNYDTR